jgi:predicted AlkP superfamily phosphohydrolase/phosphomutase
MEPAAKKPNRRTFLKRAAAVGVAAGVIGGGVYLGSVRRVSRAAGKKVIVIGIDGMDPRLSEQMMRDGELKNLAKLRAAGGFSQLGTSIPPQSPVAWANFINGAGPGSHGIFDFVHRHPEDLRHPFYSAAETIPGEGGWNVGDFKIPLDFWPFKDKPPRTVLRRQGTPFWDYLDEAGVPSTFYDLPSNYPPSPSKCGHHRCICGMGTPDALGSYGTYQYFYRIDKPTETDTKDPDEEKAKPNVPRRLEGGFHTKLAFENHTARVRLVGPENSLLKKPKAVELEMLIHRDSAANAAVIEVGGKRIVLKAGQWSRWKQLDFDLRTPSFLPGKTVSGICRFYLQEAAPNFRLYVSPINIDPAAPAVQISEPASFITDVAKKRGPFYTTGFQEDHKARTNGVFDDKEYLEQATEVLRERFALLEYAIQNYDDGLLFFYFSSSDLQSHIFWWTGDEPHPSRPPDKATEFFGHIKKLYRDLDKVIGDLHERYGSVATIIVMSDHGFANFGWQFNLNSWLRDHDHLNPGNCRSIRTDPGDPGAVDWSQTKAYGLGINGLYLNLKGREPHGIIEPGKQAEELVNELVTGLLDVKWLEQPVIRNVYRADKVYSGNATALAPDLIIGYHRGFRASWKTALGELENDAIAENKAAWSADHCADALEVPGVLWCNQPIRGENPALVDVAPSILAAYGLQTPATMTGRNFFG